MSGDESSSQSQDEPMERVGERLPMDDSAMPSDLLDMLTDQQEHSQDLHRPVRRVLQSAQKQTLFSLPALSPPLEEEGEDQQEQAQEEEERPSVVPSQARPGNDVENELPGQDIVDGPGPAQDEGDAGDVPFSLQGLTMPAQDAAAEGQTTSERDELAKLESALRAVELAVAEGAETSVSVPVAVAAARPGDEVVEGIYRAAFATAVRGVRERFRENTAAALQGTGPEDDPVSQDQAEGMSNAFDVALTRPALLALARESKGIDFGAALPVPSVLLRVYFVEYLFRFSPAPARRQLGAEVTVFGTDDERDTPGERYDAPQLPTERLRAILQGNAAWPAYKTWLAAVQDGPLGESLTEGALDAVGALVGLDLAANKGRGGGVVDSAAYAKAKERSLFTVAKFRAIVERVARESVIAAQVRAAEDRAQYTEQSVAALQRAGQLLQENGQEEDGVLPVPTYLVTLPIADRRERLFAAAEQVTLPEGTEEAVLRTINAYVTTGTARDGVAEQYVLSREFTLTGHADAVAGQEPLQRALSRVYDGGKGLAQALRGVVFETRQHALVTAAAGLRARVRAKKRDLQKQVPLVAHRMERDATAFVLRVSATGAPRQARVLIVWYFLPFALGGNPALVKREYLGSANTAELRVVERAPCGSGGQRKAYTAAVAGFYWAEAIAYGKRQDGSPRNGPVLGTAQTPRAELHVHAKCVRDGAIFELTGQRVFGECVWRSGPDTRKRKLDRALYLEDAAQRKALSGALPPVVDEEKPSNEPIDLRDDRAVLNAVEGFTMSHLANEVYGYESTLLRVSERLEGAAKARVLVTPLPLLNGIVNAAKTARVTGQRELPLLAFVKAVCEAYTESDLREALPGVWARAVSLGRRAKVLQNARDLQSVPVLLMLGVLQIAPASVAVTGNEAQFFFEIMPQRMLGEFLLAKEGAFLEGQFAEFGQAKDVRTQKEKAFQAVARMSVHEVLSDAIWRKNTLFNDFRVKRAFFTDTASLDRLLDAEKEARARFDAVQTAGPSLQWTGVHDANLSSPHWYRVAFEKGATNEGAALATCKIVQRGSELPGVVGGMHETIEKTVGAYNAAVARANEGDVAAGGQGATAAKLRVGRLRGQVEKLVAKFNEKLAKTSL